MKKKGIIILSILAVIVIAVIVTVVLVFVKLNKNKDALTVDEFNKKMTNKGFSIVDVTSQYAEYDYIKKGSVAYNEKEDYQIEFYKLEDKAGAEKFFNINKTIFEYSKGSTSTQNSVTGKNYSKYELTSDGRYMVISIIDDTAVYVDVDTENKSDVKDILKDLGY